MMSLAKPSAANRTIFARMTSRYGDVYLRALAVSSSRSILLNSMEYGLRRGIGTSRSGVCQTKRKSTLKIRHYIYEHEYLVAIGLWDVKDADQAVPHPFQKGMAKGLSTEANVFAHLYFGLGLRTVPPDGRLRLVLDAADAQLAAQKIAGWQKGLSEAKARWAQTVPSVAALYDSLALHAQGPRSTVEFTVDRKLARNLQSVVNELLSAIFSGFGGARRSRDVEQRAERIDTSPLAFQPTASA